MKWKGAEREYVFGFLLNRRAKEKTRQITTDEISVYELQKFFPGRLSFKKFLRRKLLNFFCILLWKQALPSNPSLLWKLFIALHSNSCVATVAVFWESHPEKLKSAVIIKTYIVQDTMSRIRQNYHEDCEALVNKQINMELHASYVYLSMVSIKVDD